MTWWDTQATPDGVFGSDMTREQYRRRTEAQARFVMEQLDIPHTTSVRVADVGCGIGRLMSQIRNEYPDMILHGIDTSHTMLAAASSNVSPPVYLGTRFNPAASQFDGAWCVARDATPHRRRGAAASAPDSDTTQAGSASCGPVATR